MFNIQNFYLVPTLYLCVLCGSQNTFALYMNRLIFKTEVESVYHGVCVEYWNETYVLSLKG